MAMDVNQRAQLGKEKRLCFSCFESADHQSRDCSRKQRYDVEGGNKYHHPLIHGAAPVFVVPPESFTLLDFERCSTCLRRNFVCELHPSTVLLQIVPIALVTSGGVKVNTFAGLWQPNFAYFGKIC